MVLLVHNAELPAAPCDLGEFYTQFPELLREARMMAARAPVRADTAGVLYVRQKQWAATHPGESLDNGQVRHTHNHNNLTIYYRLPYYNLFYKVLS